MAYTTALYFRISVDDGNPRESDSIQNQRGLLREFAAADPVISSGEILEFADDGWSGTTFDRPQVKKLLDAVRRGGIQCVVVKDVSRWGRNYIEVCEYIEQIFPFLGVRFISLNDQYDSTDGTSGSVSTEVMFNTFMHEVYCKELSFKVRQSYIEKARKGEFLCGEAPFGYVKSKTEKNKLEIDGEAAAVVRRIFNMACDGMGNTRIAAALNSGKADSPAVYRRRMGRPPRGNPSALCGGGMWTDKNVRRILTDERYTGVQVSGKTKKPGPGSRKAVCLPESQWIKVPGAHDPIVTEEIFAKANAGISRYKPTGRSPKRHALFAGKIRCGYCGRALRHQHAQNSYHYCAGARLGIDAGCFDGRVYVEDIQAVALAAVKAEARKVYDGRKKQDRAMRRESTSRQALFAEEKRLAAQAGLLERRGILLYEDFADGKMSREEYLAAKEACVGELAGIEARAGQIAARRVDPADRQPDDGPALQRILNAGDLTDEALSLIDCVVVYDPGRIEIRFAFGDTNTVEA